MVDWTTLSMYVARAIALLTAIPFHEMAHAWASDRLGDPTAKRCGRLSMNPLRHFDPLGALCMILVGFGWAKPVPINPRNFRNYKRDMALVSISGVITNILLAFLAVPLFMLCSRLDPSNLFFVFLTYLTMFLVVINISLAVFNLLPIYPLDGFNFINTFLKYGNKFSQFMYKYGSIILLVLIITGLFGFAFNYVANGILDLFLMFWGLMF